MPTRRTPGPCSGLADGDGQTDFDGVPDSRWLFSYDEQQRLVSVEADYGMDGSADTRVSFDYSGQGRQPTGERYDCNADGNPEELFTYLRDKEGRKRMALIKKVGEHARHCPFPDRAPAEHLGRQQRRWEAEAAALGHPSMARIDAYVAYHHDRAGRVVREEWDMDGDGAVEEIIHMVRDHHGNLMLEYHDDGPDGVIDILVRYDHSCWSSR